MKKNILLFIFFSVALTSFAQRSQRIAYIDMDYILKSIPEYKKAQNSLDVKIQKWKNKLDKQVREIEIMKTDLANEKAILTKELISEREEDITIKEDELKKLENSYFGPEGKMYTLRKQLVQPVQDQVYNAVQNIARRKKYDFVFDKSSDLIMLYTNKKYDISDFILKLIRVDQRKQNKAEKIAARKELLKSNSSKAQEDKSAKEEELRKKRIADKQAKYNKIQAKREALLKEREAKRKLLLEKRKALKKAREEAKKTKENK